jgi:hypothetical protein
LLPGHCSTWGKSRRLGNGLDTRGELDPVTHQIVVGLVDDVREMDTAARWMGSRLLPRPKASPRIPFALSLVASLIEVARGAFRVVLLRGVIPEERHQAVPEFLQHMPDKADHGLRHFIEVGVDQVRQFSAAEVDFFPAAGAVEAALGLAIAAAPAVWTAKVDIAALIG